MFSCTHTCARQTVALLGVVLGGVAEAGCHLTISIARTDFKLKGHENRTLQQQPITIWTFMNGVSISQHDKDAGKFRELEVCKLKCVCLLFILD